MDKSIADRIRDVADVLGNLIVVRNPHTSIQPAFDLRAIASEIEEKAEEILKRCPANRGYLTHFIECDYCKWADSLARRKET